MKRRAGGREWREGEREWRIYCTAVDGGGRGGARRVAGRARTGKCNIMAYARMLCAGGEEEARRREGGGIEGEGGGQAGCMHRATLTAEQAPSQYLPVALLCEPAPSWP